MTRLACLGCRHYEWGWLDDDRCAAFPDGVPREIWLGDADHSKPFPGDGGVRFDPVPSEEAKKGLVQIRRDAWSQRVVVDGIVHTEHEDDPLGALVTSAEGGTLVAATVEDATVQKAWRVTRDAAAMLAVLLRAKRFDDLARAVLLTRLETELEGCDYTDDKEWLGIGLSLASYETVGALSNAKAAWAALVPPYGGEYTSARTEQMLLRNIRRVVPVAPAVAEWAGADKGAGLGQLTLVAPAIHLAAAKAMRMEDVVLLEPWARVTNATDLEAELARELMVGHSLYSRPELRAVAKRVDSDDVLFIGDNLVAVVSLTWAKDTKPELPKVQIHPSLDQWVARRMKPDHRAYAGAEPRAFAFAFQSIHSFEKMVLELLPDRPRWDWVVRDSSWWGEYIWGKSGATRIRFFRKEEEQKLVVQVDLVGEDTGGEGWYAMTKATTKVQLLGAIDATDIVEQAPEDET